MCVYLNNQEEYYTIIELCWGGHGVYWTVYLIILTSAPCRMEVNMIKFTVL